jgi:hypothetical protein
MLFVVPIVFAEDQNKEISADEAMKYFCATWRNPAYFEDWRVTGIKIMNKNGTFKFYKNETSESPIYSGTYKIKKSWIDKDGNVWLNVIFDTGLAKKFYFVIKISDNGNKFESIMDWNVFPTVDPETWPYIIMYKK